MRQVDISRTLVLIDFTVLLLELQEQMLHHINLQHLNIMPLLYLHYPMEIDHNIKANSYYLVKVMKVKMVGSNFTHQVVVVVDMVLELHVILMVA